MKAISYLNFDLQIVPFRNTYRSLVESPVGQARSEFSFPFSKSELREFFAVLGQARESTIAADLTPIELKIKEFGERLFNAAFGDEVATCFRRSLDDAGRSTRGLRIRLRLNGVSELSILPWEFLYDTARNRFLSLSRMTPIIRLPNLDEPTQALSVKPPLKILVAIASPYEFPQLNVETEYARIEDALKDPINHGLLQLSKLENATLASLLKTLADRDVNILHFIGHSRLDKESREAQLLFEDEQGRGHTVTGIRLGTLVQEFQSLRLVVLNSCESARTTQQNPHSGVAQQLIRFGIPAVIAMQYEITDNGAINLARSLYSAVATGHSIDTALAEARRDMYARGSDFEWGTPSLYMRSPDGRIFDLDITTSDDADDEASPFVFGIPIILPRHFFGRERELRRLFDLWRSWKKTPLQNAAVIGRRHSGKTSMLYYLRSIATADPSELRGGQRADWLRDPQNFRWILVDFKDPRLGTRRGLLRYLLAYMDLPATGPSTIEHFIEVVSGSLRLPTIILLNGIGLALRNYPELDTGFWNALRALTISPDVGGKLGFVMASSQWPIEPVDKVGSQVSSPFFNIFGTVVELESLTERDARELIASSSIKFPWEDVKWILEHSQRWPAALQVLCRERLLALKNKDVSNRWQREGIVQIKRFELVPPPQKNPFKRFFDMVIGRFKGLFKRR